MALYITDPEAESLVRALAAATGESVTAAVMRALRERLQREMNRRPDPTLCEDLRRIRDRFSGLPVLDARSADEILEYDENGLPT